jgi:hypothetical protein
MAKFKKINQNTPLKDILSIKGAKEILTKYNLPCLFCPMISYEIENLKIGEICQMYGINTDELLKELNSLLENEN